MNYAKIKRIVKEALKEDLGRRDISTELILPEDKIVKALLLAKEDCVICGLDITAQVFKARDKNIQFLPLVKDGQGLKKGKMIARIKGKAKAILTAERVALNFLSLLSGISTKVRKYLNIVRPYKVKIMDTRKTIPGLRFLEKYAVRTGGGHNHRFKLDEMILLKDNHLTVIKGFGGIKGLAESRKRYRFEIEVKNLKEFKEALRLKPDIIMLDNMSIKNIRKAVKIRNSLGLKTHSLKPRLEASGGISLQTIKRVAATGIEMISIGDLTHSIESVDISLEIL